MKKMLRHRLALAWTLPLFILFMNKNTGLAQTPVIDSVVLAAGQVEQYGKFECTLYLKAAVLNPYDYDEIQVQGIFTGPDGQSLTVDGFFMEDFSLNTATGNLTALGAGHFKLRFCPASAGAWAVTAKVTTAAGTATAPTLAFTCTASGARGFIRRSGGNYFRFDNGEPYVPVGQNVAWQNNNIYLDYKNWLGDMAANGANFFRLWMASWGLGIEWKNNTSGFSGLKKYKQSAAYYLDWIADFSAANGLYLMLTLNYHGQYSTTVNPNWSENPYNAALGGPLSKPQDFFTNAAARALHKNRLRYIVARWGYATHIQCWELFNEVDLTESFDSNAANVVNWHAEMAAYLKAIDPYRHLVSTSGSKPAAFDDIWELNDIDFTQEHLYLGVANIEVPIAETARRLLSNFNKPALVAEFGLSGSGAQTASDDPTGIHLHNGMWAGLFSGAAGTAMTWWWDNYVEPKNLYHHFAPLAAIAKQLPFSDAQFETAAAGVSGGPPSDASFSPTAGWAAPTAAQFTVDADGKISPDVTQLGQFLYGAQWNTQYRNPPQFTVTFPTASKFRVRTGNNAGQAPKIVIYLDGVQALSQSGQVATTYAINVPAGQHVISVDNQGTDWIEIAEYVFEKIGSSLDAFVLRSAGKTKAAGWLHQKQYNWEYLKNNGALPSPISGLQVSIPGMAPGAYALRWWDCSTGNLQQTTSATADAAGQLLLACPQILWDVAFSAEAETSAIAEADAQRPGAETFFPTPATPDSPVFWAAEQAAPGPWSVRFYNVHGQLLRQTTLPVSGAGPVALPVQGLPAGLLMVTLDNGRELRRGKVIVGL